MFPESEQQSERLTASAAPDTATPSSAAVSHLQPIFGMEDFNPEDQDPRPLHRPSLRRVLLVLTILAGLAVLLFVPPLVSMNRYRRQIASSISASLGRPVRIDSVALNLLPVPGLTLKNFVVGEDPAFGSEPILRANSVTAMLRVRSLWGHRVEFSRILLDAPSVNLVRLPDGRWNLESILLQASRVKAAPTAQARAGDAPRFPYIEAIGARLNLKSGLEKLPISLTDATFALWLPQPDRWQLRLEAHPARTDTAATDTGTLRIDGSLGRAHRLEDVPLNLTASWSGAPLGAASWILLGRDAGIRGDLSLRASAAGTAGASNVVSELQLTGLRRADFVPDRPLALDLRCGVHALALFHRLEQIHCIWPRASGAPGLEVSGDLPDINHVEKAQVDANLNGIPAAALLNTFEAASPRLARDLHASGTLAGELRCGQPSAAALPSAPVTPRYARVSTSAPEPGLPLSGSFRIGDASFSAGPGAPFFSTTISGIVSGEQVEISPIALALGGVNPAMLGVHMDRTGYHLHLSGPLLRSRLAQLAQAVPQFGDGLLPSILPPASGPSHLPEPVLHVDLESSRTWHGGQTWSAATLPRPARRLPSHRRRNAAS